LFEERHGGRPSPLREGRRNFVVLVVANSL
jgi:hypothetical protein